MTHFKSMHTNDAMNNLSYKALGEAECYICHETHQELYILYKMQQQCFKCFIVFYTKV